MKHLGLAVAAMLVGSSTSTAVECVGEVTLLALQMNTVGTVTLSLAGGPSVVYLCDTDGAGRNGVSPVVCRTMYASLLAAKTAGKRVLIR